MEKYIPALITLIFSISGCAYAAFRGGAPERWAAGVFVVNIILSDIALYISKRQFHTTEPGLVVVDTLLLVALIWLALRAQRYWPMWAAAFQVDAILTHVLMLSRTTMPLSYAMILWLWALPIPVLIGVGAWRHRRRIKLWGNDPAWT